MDPCGLRQQLFQPLSPSDCTWHMFDVGGTRAERRNWLHVLQDADLVFFHVDLCCYDISLSEDETANRMAETLMLWERTVNGQWFQRTAFVLFFTKLDCLASNVVESPPQLYFVEMTGEPLVDDFKSYLMNRFLGPVRDEGLIVKVVFESLTEDQCQVASRALALGEEAIKEPGERISSSTWEVKETVERISSSTWGDLGGFKGYRSMGLWTMVVGSYAPAEAVDASSGTGAYVSASGELLV